MWRAVEEGLLEPDFLVVTDLGKVSVRDMLANPEAYDGLQIPDPLEPDYDGGRKVAIIYLDQNPQIWSFARGGRLLRLIEPGKPSRRALRALSLHRRALRMNIYIPNRRGEFLDPEDSFCTEFAGDIISFNDLHEALTVVRFGGKTKIVTWTNSEARPGTKVPAFFDIAAMSAYYANRFVLIPDGQGNLKQKPLFQEWMKHPKAPRADGITLAASEERFVNGALNLWTGLAVQPKPGAWPLLRKHIEDSDLQRRGEPLPPQMVRLDLAKSRVAF